MILIRKYTDRNYCKNTYSAALLQNDAIVEKWYNLSDDSLKLLLEKYSHLSYEVFEVKSKANLNFKNSF